jgi:hypothetical protein
MQKHLSNFFTNHIRPFLLNIQKLFLNVNVWAGILIAASFAIGLCWICFTGFIEDDAYITFRFAKEIASGNGFVYNPGERIYGTTTPMFTLLLAGWIKFISTDVVLGARTLSLFAFAGTLFFTWKTLKALKRSTAEQLFTLAVILCFTKMAYMSIYGMEMPLVTFLMAVSWYAHTTGRITWSGILCGLLLWARVDLAFWPLALVIVTGLNQRRDALRVVLFSALTYLPWIIFATLYFGSPIPHTVIAKWVAYSAFNHTSYFSHVLEILKYLSPFEMDEKLLFAGPLIILSIIVWGIWRGALVRQKAFLVLILFILIDAARLTFTRATFFSRYFIPLLWVTLILFGIGLGIFWNMSQRKRTLKLLFNLFLLLTFSGSLVTGFSFAGYVKTRQANRYDASLKEIGLWLNKNSDPHSTVLLEPLGYVGYYSDRIMIDEVGLVTPDVVALQRKGIGAEAYIAIFHPDYVILHCDDALYLYSIEEVQLAKNYTLSMEYNPLSFNPLMPDEPTDTKDIMRNACYQIWQKKGLE